MTLVQSLNNYSSPYLVNPFSIILQCFKKLVSMIQTTLGIDIGGTHTKYGLVDKQGNLLMEGTMPTTEHKEVNEFLEVLYRNITTKFKAIEENFELMAVGVGAPNGNFYNGTIEHAPNLNY
jgi:glucokinase